MSSKTYNAQNTQVILSELEWLKRVVKKRFDAQNSDYDFASEIPDLNSAEDSFYKDLVGDLKLTVHDRLILITSLVRHISPETFTLMLRDEKIGIKVNNISFGGYFDPIHNHFIPTLQTILYLLAGADNEVKMNYYNFIMNDCVLFKEQIISLSPGESTSDEINELNHSLNLTPEYKKFLLLGHPPRPDFGKNFPAKLITTSLNWEHLVVHRIVRAELERITRWCKFGDAVIKRGQGRINQSFPCLFHGPPGTGKTLAAQLLGKQAGMDVFKVDLSLIVNKYIGETEKNLSALFDRAENKNWILFFDEADSLFGKRGDVKDANDKYANLEMSYLLQRMEDHNGLTILATNLKGNLDNALIRRFQSVIYFSRPDKDQRLQLWKNLEPNPYRYAADVNLNMFAEPEMSGAAIANCIKAACLEAESRNSLEIQAPDLINAVNRESVKDGGSAVMKLV